MRVPSTSASRSMLSQISRGSKAWAESIVKITESAKVRAAGPGSIRRDEVELHQRRQDRNHEDVDHRPAPDVLDHLVEPHPDARPRPARRGRTDRARKAMARNLEMGMATLATRMMTATPGVAVQEQVDGAHDDGVASATVKRVRVSSIG